MREIKFRAFVKPGVLTNHDNGIVCEAMPDFYTGICEVLYMDNQDSSKNVMESLEFEDFELLEYAGLKDKNGVDIYEGDIIRCYTHSLSKVEVKKGCFGLTSKGLHDPYFTPFVNVCGYCEILGNVYENPELLEG